MTNTEALLAQSAILKNMPTDIVTFYLEEQELVEAEEYTTANRRALDLAHAGLLLYIATEPQTIRELDWQGTPLTIADLLRLRKGLLAKWGVSEGTGPTVKAVSPW